MQPVEMNLDELGPYNPLIDLSIVIISWNTANLLHTCLSSISRNAGLLRYEVIVVDNGSRDGSVEMITRDFPKVRLLLNGCNTGFAAANNQGFKYAHGRYLLMLNSDTIVLPGALEEMARFMDTHPRVGVVGPRLLNEDGSFQVSVFPLPHVIRNALVILEVKRWPVLGKLAQRYAQKVVSDMSVQTGEVDCMLGACLMLRRSTLEQVGVLDPGYFFGTEETDLFFRLHQHEWAAVYLTSAEIIHLGGQSWAHMSPSRMVWIYTAGFRYFLLHHKYWEYVVQRIATGLFAATHIMALLLRRHRSVNDRLLLAAFARILAHAVHDDVSRSDPAKQRPVHR